MCGEMMCLNVQLRGRSLHRRRFWGLGMRLRRKDLWKTRLRYAPLAFQRIYGWSNERRKMGDTEDGNEISGEGSCLVS